MRRPELFIGVSQQGLPSGIVAILGPDAHPLFPMKSPLAACAVMLSFLAPFSFAAESPFSDPAKYDRAVQGRQGSRAVHGRYTASDPGCTPAPRDLLTPGFAMTFGPATYGLGLIAGALSTLSPCVLPLVPVLIASAVNAHRWGALALAAGLASSFTVIGIFLAAAGASLSLDPDTFRMVGAVILAVFGLILLVPRLQSAFAGATGSLSNSGNQLTARLNVEGLAGQFLVGLLLGVVWSPCVGPTLGAATTLASQGRDLGQIALLMLVFGIGAAAPLVLLGSLSRASLMHLRGRQDPGLAHEYHHEVLDFASLAAPMFSRSDL